MRNLSALFLTSMVVSVAYGQTSVQGVVKDGTSMISMPGVTISIKGKAVSTKTDATGKFQINASPTDSLVFNFLGYRTQTVYIKESRSDRIDQLLEIIRYHEATCHVGNAIHPR